MRVKKAVAFFLAAGMLLGGCGTAASDTSSKETTDGTVAQTTEETTDGTAEAGNSEEETPKGKYKEPVEVSISKVMVTNPHLIEGQSPEKNIVLDLIKELKLRT